MPQPVAPQLEYKSTKTEFKAVEGDRGEYEGYFSVIGNKDDGNDVIHPGAFTKTIQERRQRVKVFYAHDWLKLIGPAPSVLREDTTGLFAAGRLTLDSFWGRETWALMKDNALNEGSIGYEPVKVDYEDANGEPIADPWEMLSAGVVRNIRELKLYEISPVPLGMNPLTSVQAVKATLQALQSNPQLQAGEAQTKADLLDGYLSTLATISTQLKEGRVLSGANKEKVASAIEALTSALDALNELLAAAEPAKSGHSTLHLERRLRAAELALASLPH